VNSAEGAPSVCPLLRNSSEPILYTLSERVALLAYDAVDDRAEAVDDVRAIDASRSKFVHHGSDVEDNESFKRFVLHGIKMFLKLIRLVDVFETKDQLLDHTVRMN
jgi:hypothetical protein